jgi:purine-binding chemotaxis protein CheW
MDMTHVEQTSVGLASATGNEMRQMVTFELNDEEFGIDIGLVREINRLMKITPVPKSPSAVKGVINLRGQVIPVVDLRCEFNLPHLEENQKTRIVVVEIDGATTAFIVDAVSEVLNIPVASIEPAPPLIKGVDSELVNSVGKLEDRLVIILDLQRVVARAAAAMEQVEHPPTEH